jgi:integrase
LTKFIEKSGKSDLVFKEVTIPFLKKFEADFKERLVKESGISFYMRTLRAVFNKAIEQRICKREMYPFDRYKISDLNTKTIKRAIPKNDIEKLKSLIIENDLRKFHSLNYFMFSYYCWGINFADVAILKWENIQNNRLTYIRLKTGKPYSLAILEPALQILEFYRSHYFRGNDNYIFPILDTSQHKTAESINNRTHKILTHTNQDLKEIGTELGISVPLTTYVARHTFATVLKRGGASTSKISEAMGHESERTTQIYLDSFENDVLDDTIKALL